VDQNKYITAFPETNNTVAVRDIREVNSVMSNSDRKSSRRLHSSREFRSSEFPDEEDSVGIRGGEES
jgi:hypothetical protein